MQRWLKGFGPRRLYCCPRPPWPLFWRQPPILTHADSTPR